MLNRQHTVKWSIRSCYYCTFTAPAARLFMLLNVMLQIFLYGYID